MSRKILVKASEIQSYLYCQREWWLQYNNKLPTTDEMELGTAHHNALARSVRRFAALKRAAALCIGLGIMLLLIYGLVIAVMR